MNVLILGLGQYPQGSGVSAALYYARRGDHVTVCDPYYTPAMDANVRQLKRFKNVRFLLGKHATSVVPQVDLIIRHQRMRDTEPELVAARKQHKPVETELSIFFRACPALIVGITGTRGKSTTSAWLAAMAKAAKKRVWLGGNILVSPLSFLSRVKKGDLVILELSSWQLETTGTVGISPPVALWTNLMRDHLNTYPDMAAYAEAKAQIFRHQAADGIALLPADKTFDVFAEGAPGHVVRFGKKGSREGKIVHSVKLGLAGEHNVKNAEAATALALELHLPVPAIKKALRDFKGLPNREEVIRVVKGVTYVNDSTATTPDATIAALKRFAGKGTIHLIFGGSDKELEFDEVAQVIKKSKVDVVVLTGTAEKKIAKAFKKAGVTFVTAKSLADAVFGFSRKPEMKKGDIVLLSPGCTSFGMFKNEFDRGEQFVKLVNKLR